MKVTRRSAFTGIVRTLDLDITEEQLREIFDPKGRLIQDIVPNLSAGEREFLLTGCTYEEWNELFGEEREEEA